MKKTWRRYKSSLKNGKGRVNISFSASHQLSFSININTIEKYKVKEFTIYKNEIKKDQRDVDKYVENIVNKRRKTENKFFIIQT